MKYQRPSWLTIALNRCPHGIEMLSLDNESGGSRFAGPKCCGSWKVIAEWPVSAKDLREIAEEAESLTEQREAQELTE